MTANTSRKPILAIVGRPNVGKSALFNKICKERISIVDEAEGVTRDRIYSEAELFGFPFRIVDTGGIDPRSKATFNTEVKRQAEIAIEEADTIVMVVDGEVGVTSLDTEIAKILLRTKKPVALAVNKIDSNSREELIYPFFRLGIKNVIGISALHNYHVAELLEMALKPIPKDSLSDAEDAGIKVALVGRPNVGKSSLLNTFMDEERCIVSPIPGTTRDSIDVAFQHGDDKFTLIDTAGVRRKRAEHEVVDKFAAIRTQGAIERSDVCILMLDVQDGMTSQDKKIANMIEEQGKGCIILFNKWDLVKGFRMEHCVKELEETVPFIAHCPKVCISALHGRNVDKILPIVKEIYEASRQRITTHQLNKVIEKAMQAYHPPMITGKRLRIYYMTQVGIEPPTFVLFVNNPHLMTDTYKKYLYNQFREAYPFTGVPLRMFLKGKPKKTAEERIAEIKQEGYATRRQQPIETSEEEIEEIAPLDGDDDDFDEDFSDVENDVWD